MRHVESRSLRHRLWFTHHYVLTQVTIVLQLLDQCARLVLASRVNRAFGSSIRLGWFPKFNYHLVHRVKSTGSCVDAAGSRPFLPNLCARSQSHLNEVVQAVTYTQREV